MGCRRDIDVDGLAGSTEVSRPRRAGATRRRTFALAMLAPIIALAGCGETAPKTTAGAAIDPVAPLDLSASPANEPAASASRGDDAATTTPGDGADASSLEALANRDVEYLLGNAGGRTRPGAGADSDPAGSARGPVTDPPFAVGPGVTRVPRDIRFNGPDAEVAAPRTPAKAAAEKNRGTPAGADASSEGVRTGIDEWRHRGRPAEPGATVAARPEPVFDPPVLDPDDDANDGRGDTDPARPLSPDRLAMLLVELRREIFQRSIDSAQPLREILGLAALAAIDPDARIHPDAFRDLTEREQELMNLLQDFMVAVHGAIERDGDAEHAVLDALEALRDALVEPEPLSVPDLQLCWRVDGYGQYDRFEPMGFLAGEPRQIIVYADIKHFTSTETPDGEWVTRISQQIEVYSDRDGIPVWSTEWGGVTDRVPTRRTDFYTLHQIELPATLPLGLYHLKLRVRDEQSKAEAEQSVSFRIEVDPRRVAP